MDPELNPTTIVFLAIFQIMKLVLDALMAVLFIFYYCKVRNMGLTKR